MSKDDKATEAREGLKDAILGKAKEVAGAVTNNDSLTAEGQLQQTEATNRREATAQQSLADAEQAEAEQKVARERQEAERERAQARREAADVANRVQQDRAGEKSQAEREADRKREADENKRPMTAGIRHGQESHQASS